MARSAAAERLRRWRLDPVLFVRENFGIEPDAWQVDALRACANPEIQRVSLQACAGPGKTAVLAWIALWFLTVFARPGQHPKGAAVSVTSDNLRDNLWPEIAKWRGKSAFLQEAFTWTKQRIFANKHPETWFLSARSWPKTASADEQGRTLSGLHSAFVLSLIDESGTIPPTVLRAAEQSLSNCEFGLIVQAGNPISRDGMLYAASSELAHQWHVVRITGDPADAKRSPRIDKAWAQSFIDQYGRDDPWVKAYILGEFPPSSFNTLLDPDDVRAAMERSANPDVVRDFAAVLGVDVSRFGDDRSVLFPRQGPLAYEPSIMRSVDSIGGAGMVAKRWDELQAEACFIDDTGGFGGGWIDQLRAIGRNPVGIHFAGKAINNRYANKRAEMWLEMADWVKNGGVLPKVPELIKELTTPTYGFKGDQLIIEDKEKVKARLQRSPDLADALALTFAMPVMSPRQRRQVRRSQGPERHDEFGYGEDALGESWDEFGGILRAA